MSFQNTIKNCIRDGDDVYVLNLFHNFVQDLSPRITGSNHRKTTTAASAKVELSKAISETGPVIQHSACHTFNYEMVNKELISCYKA